MTLPDKFKFTCETEIPPHSIVYTASIDARYGDMYASYVISWDEGGKTFTDFWWCNEIEIALASGGWRLYGKE